MKKILEMNHVQKSFNDNTLHVLKDISLSVSEGEVVSIIGPSGSGKSTLLRCATLLTGKWTAASFSTTASTQPERSQRAARFIPARLELKKDPQHFRPGFPEL